eukprot:GGOE01041467.1.p1 GENE.GGOE01041467.1~~GGOE01041467.1.p1  ORF type:complete len:331 (+),score=73.14 GGOE01041467.1:27-995(+)
MAGDTDLCPCGSAYCAGTRPSVEEFLESRSTSNYERAAARPVYEACDIPAEPLLAHAFRWLPVQVGHTYRIPIADRLYDIITVCTRPAVFAIPDFVAEAERKALIKTARKRLEPALVSGPNGKEVDAALRNCKQAQLDITHSAATMALTARAIELMSGRPLTRPTHSAASASSGGTPERLARPAASLKDTCGGYLTVLCYREHQHFSYHYDSGGPHRRMATLLYYLNQVERGGGTHFPFAHLQAGDTVDPRRAPGLVVRPRPGVAVLFYNYLPDGRADRQAVHAGLDVVEGEKWAANQWVTVEELQLPATGGQEEPPQAQEA